MFRNAASVSISGGQFNEVGRDQINLNFINNLQATVVSRPNEGSLVSNLSGSSKRKGLSAARAVQFQGCALSVERTLTIPRFAEVEIWLQAIAHLLDVSPVNLSALLCKEICELTVTVAFSRRAYLASRKLTVHPLLNRMITKRMEHCLETLRRVHAQMAKLPYGTISTWDRVGQVLLGWLLRDSRVPEDVLSICLELINEIELYGEYLGSLKS